MSKIAYNIVAATPRRISVGMMAVALQLAWFADQNGGSCWPSVRTMASRTKLNRSSVQRILRKMEAEGGITAVGSRLGGRSHSTRYILVLSWFEAQGIEVAEEDSTVKGRIVEPIETEKGSEKGPHFDTERAAFSGIKGRVVQPDQERTVIKRKEETEKPQTPINGEIKEKAKTESYSEQAAAQATRSAVRKRLDAKKFPDRLNPQEFFERKRLLLSQLAQFSERQGVGHVS